jgi:hypothetical protein
LFDRSLQVVTRAQETLPVLRPDRRLVADAEDKQQQDDS